jgi:hypothetical protein
MMKKTLAFSIVLLFIGVAFAPSLYADVKTINEQQELIEIPIQICGLGGINEHTAKLSKEDANKLDTLFEYINRRLNASESREETISIYKDAVVELDNLGLLGGYSIEQVQKLVTGELYENSLIMKFLKLPNRDNHESVDYYENSNCFVNGEVTNSYLWPFLPVYLITLGGIIPINWQLLSPFWMLINIYVLRFFGLGLCKSVSLCGYISIGDGAREHGGGESYDTPSQGWIRTEGINGIIEINGSLCGALFKLVYDSTPVFLYIVHFGGSGFTGLKVGNSILGYAQKVKLSSPPTI